MKAWFSGETKTAVREAVGSVESETSAELVVVVRRLSGNYLAADLIGGGIVAMIALAVFLYYPEPFEYTYFPLEQLAAFAVGALLTRASPSLRRMFTGEKAMRREVTRAARSTFMERRLGRTRDRTAVLVYVSTFEGLAEVVPDVGLDTAKLGDGWADAVKIVLRAVRDDDLASFTLALRALGPILSEVSPKAKDDTNEIPGDVDAEDDTDSSEEDGTDEDEADEEATTDAADRGGAK